MTEPPISRGFRSRRPQPAQPDRLPRGKYVTTHFPVFTSGPAPQIKLDTRTFAVQHGGVLAAKLTWAGFEALRRITLRTGIHRVTKWSKLDTTWSGVTIDTLLQAAGLSAPPTAYAMIHCDGACTANAPVANLVDGKAMITTHYEGLPLLSAHGGPARLLVPHLYFWKSAK